MTPSTTNTAARVTLEDAFYMVSTRGLTAEEFASKVRDLATLPQQQGGEQEAGDGSDLGGTFACPICGKTAIHKHSYAEVMQAKEPQPKRVVLTPRQIVPYDDLTDFEKWYADNTPDYEERPLHSPRFEVQRIAWIAALRTKQPAASEGDVCPCGGDYGPGHKCRSKPSHDNTNQQAAGEIGDA